MARSSSNPATTAGHKVLAQAHHELGVVLLKLGGGEPELVPAVVVVPEQPVLGPRRAGAASLRARTESATAAAGSSRGVYGGQHSARGAPLPSERPSPTSLRRPVA